MGSEDEKRIPERTLPDATATFEAALGISEGRGTTPTVLAVNRLPRGRRTATRIYRIATPDLGTFPLRGGDLGSRVTEAAPVLGCDQGLVFLGGPRPLPGEIPRAQRLEVTLRSREAKDF